MKKKMMLKWAGRNSYENRYEVARDGKEHEIEVLAGTAPKISGLRDVGGNEIFGDYLTAGIAVRYSSAFCAKNVKIGEFVKICKDGTARRIAAEVSC